MSNTQHMPGPWEIHEMDNAYGYQIISRNPRVYIMGSIAANGAGISGKSGKAKANASLISAAPDLLASCIAMMRYMEEGFLVRDTSNDASSDWALKALAFVKDMKAMHAAVSKAEGRS